jgi:hypothetical protein
MSIYYGLKYWYRAVFGLNMCLCIDDLAATRSTYELPQDHPCHSLV